MTDDNFKEYVEMGDLALEEEKYKEAIKLYTKALHLNPRAKGVWEKKGAAYGLIGDIDKAHHCYNNEAKVKGIRRGELEDVPDSDEGGPLKGPDLRPDPACPHCGVIITQPVKFSPTYTCTGCGKDITFDQAYNSYRCSHCEDVFAIPNTMIEGVCPKCGGLSVPVDGSPDEQPGLFTPMIDHLVKELSIEPADGIEDHDKVAVVKVRALVGGLVPEVRDELLKTLHMNYLGAQEPLSGNDCPSCGKKGTVFRCPRRRKGGHWDDGSELICFVCVNCTMNLMGSEGCTPGWGKGKHEDMEYWNDTPEMSWDLYEAIIDLYVDQHRLHQIRKAIWPDMPSRAEKEIPQTIVKDAPTPGPTRRPPRGPPPRL